MSGMWRHHTPAKTCRAWLHHLLVMRW